MLQDSDKLNRWKEEGFISDYRWEIDNDPYNYSEVVYETLTLYFPNGKEITIQTKDSLDFW